MKKYLVLVMAFLLLLVPSIYADYNETGNYDNYFRQGTGFFNSELTSIDSFTRSISTQRQTPLISDLDGDGINEIIILDGSTFKLFHDKSLDIVDSYDLPFSSGQRISNFLTFDIDNDGYREIIIVNEEPTTSDFLHILEYNGTNFYNQSSFFIGTVHSTGQIMIKCESIERCLMVFTDNDYVISDGLSVDNLYGVHFNSTGISWSGQLHLKGTSLAPMCFPKIRTMAVADYDGDNDIEFIFSVIKVGKNSDESVLIFWIDISTNNTIVIEQEIEETRVGNLLTGYSDCSVHNQGRWITSPLVFDIDGSSSNNLETVIGTMIDSDEFKMFSYKSDGSNLDDYPETFQADGVLISNVIRTNAFIDTTDEEFCVMGYDDVDEEIDLLCASEQATWNWLFINYESIEFLFDVSGLYNITQTYGNWNVISHSAQHSTITTSGNNLDEIISPYGVLSLDWLDVCRIQIPPIRCLDLIFENPKQNGVVISSDVEQIGRDDLLVLTSTNLWYLDDIFLNTPAQIDEYYINPCIDSTWNMNTTSEIRITPIDIDNDLVSARTILYYNDDNEQDSGWSANVSSGTTISFGDLKANKTIPVGVLRLMARDIENPLEEDIIDLTFSVAPNGVVFGECTTISTGLVEEEEELIGEECVSDDDCGTASCIGGVCVADEDTLPVIAMAEASRTFRMGVTTLWLMFMMALAIGFWFAPIGRNNDFFDSANARFGVIILGEIFMLVLGTMFGFLPVAILLSIIILGLISISIWVIRRFTGASA